MPHRTTKRKKESGWWSLQREELEKQIRKSIYEEDNSFTFFASSFCSVGTEWVTEKQSEIPTDSKKVTSLVVPKTRSFFPCEQRFYQFKDVQL